MTKPILLFDVMDTLVADPFFDAVPKFFGLTLEELLKQKHPDSWIEFEKGRLTEDEYLASFFADGRPIDKAAYREMLRENYEWLPGAEQLLDELAAAGYVMHSMSNYSIWYEIIEDKLQLGRFLPWTFVSQRTGLRKPDPACYQLAVEQLSAPADQIVFIDDRQANVDGARGEGINGILFRDIEQLRADFVKIGVLDN